MANIKIIKADDLRCLKCAVIEEIDNAQIQAELYRERAEKQKHTKQSAEIIERTERLQKDWLETSQILHNCLVKIEKHSSEIEI